MIRNPVGRLCRRKSSNLFTSAKAPEASASGAFSLRKALLSCYNNMENGREGLQWRTSDYFKINGAGIGEGRTERPQLRRWLLRAGKACIQCRLTERARCQYLGRILLNCSRAAAESTAGLGRMTLVQQFPISGYRAAAFASTDTPWRRMRRPFLRSAAKIRRPELPPDLAERLRSVPLWRWPRH